MNKSKKMIPVELIWKKKIRTSKIYNIHLREIATVYLILHKMYF